MLEMAVIGFNLIIIAIVSCANARGPICLDCLVVRSPDQCQTVTECKSTEKCFTDFFLYNDDTPAFSFGCRKPQDCVHEVNHNHEVCESYCHSDLCNNNICTNGTAPPTGIPCLDCTSVSSTDKCYRLTYCQEGEVCYSEEYHTQHGLAYKLGCLKKEVCSFLGAAIIGRRSETNVKPRHTCCEAAGCNYAGSSYIELATIPAKTTQATTPATTPATWIEGIYRAKDCWDLQTNYNITEDGVYAVQTSRGLKSYLRCDMTTDGGGWTVFQRRGDGSVSFNQTYEAYRSQFGILDGEFWMGNDFLYQFTHDVNQTLRVDLCDWDNETRWAEYEEFSVGPPLDKYRLHVAGYNGTAGDSLIKTYGDNHNGLPFTTRDSDNDQFSKNCGALYSSGWWFNACLASNLNGVYRFEGHLNTPHGILWSTWIWDKSSLKGAEMKMRPSAATPLTDGNFTCPVIQHVDHLPPHHQPTNPSRVL